MVTRQFLTTSTLLIGFTLSGCATKQVWVPELEQAQETYAEISQDPVVQSLAPSDLESARNQLRRAEDASAMFRKPQNIAHEAQLATLKTLTAQQRARALSSSHSVQVALGQNPLLSEEQIAAATIIEPSPVMAAATPGDPQSVEEQLAALLAQVASLKAQLEGKDSITDAASDAQLLNAQPQRQLAPVQQTEPVFSTIAQLQQPATAQPEPVLAAALRSDNQTAAQQPLPNPTQISHKLRAMNAKPNTRGMSLTLGERYFDNGSSRLLSQRATRHMDNVAALLKQNPSLAIAIEGHTDNQPSVQDSQDLSVNRAVSIKTALVLRGIDPGRINTRGFGHTRPIADNGSELGRLQNRRVELIFPVQSVSG